MIAVFLGPTLSEDDAARELDAVYLPPAAQGDVYRAARRGATAIGIVDGYFQQVPSVWHKEILWAISEGVPVFGSASMGALRAAELCAYGMVGVGEIFETFRDAQISDDDEVALTHLGPEDGHRASSVAMVDIRATLELAERDGVIRGQTCAVLADAAKALWFGDRSYKEIVRQAHGRADPDELEAFESWWPAEQVSRKRKDALAMLRRMRTDASEGTWPVAPAFAFERTALFDELASSARARDADAPLARVELRTGAVELARGGSVRDAALARVLALDVARGLQFEIDDDRLYEAVIAFRVERELATGDDLESWMSAHHLDRNGFLRLAADEARIAWVRRVLEDEIDAMTTDHLRVSGQFQKGGAT